MQNNGLNWCPAIFESDWWLEAAAPGAWDRVSVSWDNVIVGEMAFHLKRRWGLTYITMPHLTRTMSPRLSSPSTKPILRSLDNQAIVGELIQKLPRHDRFERALSPDCPSRQGFVHANLTLTHMFTFRSAPGDTPDTMLQQAHPETRRIIGKAKRECTVERSKDIERFIRLHLRTYGETSTVDYVVLPRLFQAAASRGQAEIIFVRVNDDADTAAMILVWDSHVTYAWLVARNSAQNYRGASSLLVFEAMSTAHKLGLILDLDGYVRPAVGAFMTKFGLQPAVRPYVNGASPLWSCLRAATTLANPQRQDKHFRV